MVQYGHYYWYLIVPVSIVTGFYMLWSLIDRIFLRKLLFSIFFILAFVNTAGGQYKSIPLVSAEKRYQQNYRPIVEFLNKDKSPGVILAPEDKNELLYIIYTNHDLFWYSGEMESQAPLQNLKDAFYTYMYLNKESRNNFIGYIDKIMDSPKGSTYKILYQAIEGYESGFDYYDYNNKIVQNDEAILDKRPFLESLLYEEYKNKIMAKDGIKDLFNKYQVKYIVWDKNRYPEWDLSVVSNIKEVFSYENIYIYQIFNN